MTKPVAVMGILNVTPDSFSDGGQHATRDAAIAHGLKLLDEGADIIDIGGETTKPGSKPLDGAEEIRRVIPVIEALKPAAREAGAKISVDTRNAATMEAALAVGADILNDISGFCHDPRSLEVAAASGTDIVIMHMQETPETMQRNPIYGDVAQEVCDWLALRIAVAERQGIPRSRIIADPGIGFGKTVEHNLVLLRALPLFHSLGVRLMVGVSRKQFISRLSKGEPPSQRLGGSLAAALFAASRGADMLRVHDVAETVQALKIRQALAPEKEG